MVYDLFEHEQYHKIVFRATSLYEIRGFVRHDPYWNILNVSKSCDCSWFCAEVGVGKEEEWDFHSFQF